MTKLPAEFTAVEFTGLWADEPTTRIRFWSGRNLRKGDELTITARCPLEWSVVVVEVLGKGLYVGEVVEE